MSDEPAMHDEKLNARSFAKRGVCPSLYSDPCGRSPASTSVSTHGQAAHHIRTVDVLQNVSNEPDVNI